MEQIPGIWSLTPYGALVGLLVFISISVIRGWFIPASSHKRELEAERRRADEWKEVALARKDTIRALVDQNTALLETGRTVEALVRAAAPPKTLDRGGEDSG